MDYAAPSLVDEGSGAKPPLSPRPWCSNCSPLVLQLNEPAAREGRRGC